jgi:TonB family protein
MGDAPVPTQDGREIAALSFEDKEYSAGPVARPSTPAAQPRQEIRPQQKTPEAQPKQETAEAEPKKTAEAESKQKTVEAEPKAKTVEVEPKMTPRPSTQLALLEPPKPQSPPRPKTAAAKAVPEQQQQPPQAVQPPGYQPQTRVTRIRGNISNRGRASVSATATPLGRYKKMLSDAIGSRWYYYVTDQISLLNVGTVEVRFVVRQSGKVERVQVVRNSSNESFAACTVRAIMEAEIPPIPKELVPMLEGGRIEIEYSFTILSN